MADESEVQRRKIRESADRGAAQIREGFGTEAQAPTKEQQAEHLAGMVSLYYREYQNAEGDERTSYRNIALDYHRQLVALVGDEEAVRLERDAADIAQEQPNTEQEPSMTDYAALLRGKPIPMNVGTAKQPIIIKRNFNDLSPAAQQQTTQVYQDIVELTGDTDPWDLIDDRIADRVGPTPEQLAAMAAAKEEQAQQRAAAAAEKARLQAERDRIRQQFAEQQAEAKRARDAKLGEERRKASESAEQRRTQQETERQADRVANWQIRGGQEARVRTQYQQQQADRAARQAQQGQQKQDAISKRLADADAKRRQIAAATAQRTANLLASTKVRLEGLPQPGGIGLLLIAIIFILFAIVPVNSPGNTRLQLMWFALLPWSGLELPSDITGASGGSGGSGGGGPTIPGTNIKIPPVTLADVFAPALTASTSSLSADASLNADMPYAVQSF